jgi:hypothetical protein
MMKSTNPAFAPASLKLLPAYTGATTIEEALRDPRGARLLWLELLVNDRLDLDPWRDSHEFQAAYNKACRWYTTYRTVIEVLVPRAPLPSNPGPVDPRDYRLFAEAIHFVVGHD